MSMVIKCENCRKREHCVMAGEGKFSFRWEPEVKKENAAMDPNKLWRAGKDVEEL